MDNTFIFHIDSTEFKYLRKQKSLNVFCEISICLGSAGRAYDSKHSHMFVKIVLSGTSSVHLDSMTKKNLDQKNFQTKIFFQTTIFSPAINKQIVLTNSISLWKI